jgi:hypothetical protein
MARINIDDELRADPRWKRLVRILNGDEEKAIGKLYFFWHMAQLYWGKECQLMPQEEFDGEDFAAIIQSKFAEVRPEGVYASGAEEQFAWYLQKCRASKEAAKAKSRKPKKPDGDNSGGPGNNSGDRSTISGTPEIEFRNTGAPTPVNRAQSSGHPSFSAPAPLRSATVTTPLRSAPLGEINMAVVSRHIGKWSKHAGLKFVQTNDTEAERRELLSKQAETIRKDESRFQGNPGASAGVAR